MNTNSDDVSGGKKCLPVMEDYYECLHHKKEVSSQSSQYHIRAMNKVLGLVLVQRLFGADVLGAFGSLPLGCEDESATACVSEIGAGTS